MLANSIKPEDGEDATDKFRRDEGGFDIVVHQNQIYAMLEAAADCVSTGIDINDLRYSLSLQLQSPTTIYSRSYRKDGETKFRKHESVGIGDKVSFQLYAPDRVTVKQLACLFEAAGKFVGLSPYGYKWGYGRFNVNTVEELADIETGQVTETQPWVPGETK